MQPIFAMIIPLSGGHPDQGLPGQPPGIWGGAPPFVDNSLPGGRPPGIWGGAPSYPDNSLPGGGGGGQPTHPIYLPPGINVPVFPTHPIAPGGSGGEGGSEVSNPIGGGFVLVWHPSYGWILVPASGLPPVTGSGNKPTQPIAPTPSPKA